MERGLAACGYQLGARARTGYALGALSSAVPTGGRTGDKACEKRPKVRSGGCWGDNTPGRPPLRCARSTRWHP